MHVVETCPWLPEPDARSIELLRRKSSEPPLSLDDMRWIGLHRLDAAQLTKLSRRVTDWRAQTASVAPLETLKLAILSNGTIRMAADTIPAAGLRHGVVIETMVVEYDAVNAAALGNDPALVAFKPDAVLLALDHRGLPLQTLTIGQDPRSVIDEAVSYLGMLADGIRESLGASVLFQTLPCPPEPVFGGLDAVVQGTLAHALAVLNPEIRELARHRGDMVLDIAGLAGLVGTYQWFDDAQWDANMLPFRYACAPIYADHVGRLAGAIRGRSRKALVLDLDNTTWGGVVGDDGVENLRIGAGDADGEAFLRVQHYAKSLRARGVLLAVCSKNDYENAIAPFRQHPDMVLQEADISIFQANWTDKPTNLEAIAAKLNIGIDALVMLDDNPAERAQIRAALPMVGVPELPDDPALYPRLLANAGYFETLSFSQEDRGRADMYAAEAKRVEVKDKARNLGDYLASLEMVLQVAPFDRIGHKRIVQLINKTNQFNLTTRRYTGTQVEEMTQNPDCVTLQFRLADRFGDSGIIGLIIANLADIQGQRTCTIDTWLMSCRVLGRRVEAAMLKELAQAARSHHADRLIGEYLPTPKNGMVAGHYEGLGFQAERQEETLQTWSLDLATFEDMPVPMQIIRPEQALAS